jgi:hypothetical protein
MLEKVNYARDPIIIDGRGKTIQERDGKSPE